MWISNVLPPNKSNNELLEIVNDHDALGYVISSVGGDCAWIPLRPQWVLRFRKCRRGIQLGLKKHIPKFDCWRRSGCFVSPSEVWCLALLR